MQEEEKEEEETTMTPSATANYQQRVKP